MSINYLIKELKEAGQDYELYPTTKEMIQCIWNHRKNNYTSRRGHSLGDILDIGCGTCNFKRFIDEINEPLRKPYRDGYDYSECVTISQYYVIEKSKILIDKLDSDTIVLGTDFHTNTLIDKPVDTIFCNPPYSEFEDWVVKIIRESVCDHIYLVIPQRWKDSEKINLALEKVSPPYRYRKNDYEEQEKAIVLGSFDFLNAERSARAKVDVVYIDKSHTSKESGFDAFFDEFFIMENPEDKKLKEDKKDTYTSLKNELATGKNKIEILCNGYTTAQQNLFNHFKVISELDADTLETIGIHKENVKKALKEKFTNLKNVYWQSTLDCLDEITTRLTSESRKKLLQRFTALKTIDFTESNIYSLLVWIIKNSNKYYKEQMIDFFYALSSKENVQNYKSNQRVFDKDNWRFHRQEFSHYTLDYRIVCTQYALPGNGDNWHYDRGIEREMRTKISDIITVANNLGFPHGSIDFPSDYGKKGNVYLLDKKTVLFEFKCYLNNNVHIKLNKEFAKALNVEVARALGWIRTKEDIAKEFTAEMANGAEKYFDRTLQIGLTEVPLMLNNTTETTDSEYLFEM